MLKIRTFRAIDDLASCKQFADGHSRVLLDYGITRVTSAKNDWFFNPDAYVIMVETEDSGEVVGGERIHLVNKEYPLPIEDAITVVDKAVHDLVAKYADGKVTGELCGLWNAKAIAGRGVSTLLTKLGVAMAHKLKMDSLFVLCAPYTVEMCQQSGFEIETSIGDNGTFIYPKLDLIATALVIKDLDELSHANEDVRKEIRSFIERPNDVTVEMGQKGGTEVKYNLL